jgi:hypothetical protein
LSVRLGRFCSPFPDTDAAFGSLGSFFDMQPATGSFQAYPPPLPEFVSRMIRVRRRGRRRG